MTLAEIDAAIERVKTMPARHRMALLPPLMSKRIKAYAAEKRGETTRER